MTEPDLDGLAALVGLTLSPGHRPGVQRFFSIARDMARQLDAAPLGDEDLLDLAPVYRLPEPGA